MLQASHYKEEELDAGLIIMGGQRRPWFERIFGAGFSEKVSRRARVAGLDGSEVISVLKSGFGDGGIEDGPASRDGVAHRLHVRFPPGPEPLRQYSLVEEHPLAGGNASTPFAS